MNSKNCYLLGNGLDAHVYGVYDYVRHFSRKIKRNTRRLVEHYYYIFINPKSLKDSQKNFWEPWKLQRIRRSFGIHLTM